MNPGLRRAAIALVIAAVATIGLLVVGVMRSMGVTCEVCVSYNGRTECRSAVGTDRDEAVRTAVQNACGLIAGGMTQTVQCQNREPVSITCGD